MSAFLAGTILAACSAAGAGPPPETPDFPLANGVYHGAKGRLVLRIYVPRRKVKMSRSTPRYISSATQAMTIAITGPVRVNKIVALTANATGCSSSLAGTLCTPKNTRADAVSVEGDLLRCI